MESKKFNTKNIDKLNDPKRVKIQDPQLIWEKLNMADPKVLVDIGVGTGFFAFPFSEKLENGTVYGCDISDEMLAWLTENMPDNAKGTVVPIKMEESSVPLENDVADLVFMANLHHELDNPDKLVAESARILKQNGKLAIIDWKKDAPFGPPPEIRVSSKTVQAQMTKAGIGNIVEHHDLPYNFFLVGQKI